MATALLIFLNEPFLRFTLKSSISTENLLSLLSLPLLYNTLTYAVPFSLSLSPTHTISLLLLSFIAEAHTNPHSLSVLTCV